jgi:hypothetical protein
MPELKDLFLERESELYNYVRYPYKEDGDTQPYRYTTLDNAEPMNNTFFEDQSNPVSLSARRDFNRMFQFSKSAQGLVFLGKQTFLQTGNTFAQTRLYNPLNVQLHSVPFVHLPRHVDVKQTIQSLFGGTSDPERYARLQKETVDESKTRATARYSGKGGILNITNQPTAISLDGIGRRLQNNVIASFRRIGSGFSAQFGNPTGGRPEADTENLVATHYNQLADKFKFIGNHLWSYTDQYYSNGEAASILYSWRDNKITTPGLRQEITLSNTIVSTGKQREIAGLYFRSNSQQRVIESPGITIDQGREFSSIVLSGERSIRIGLANRYVYDFNESPPSIKDEDNVSDISYQTKLDEWIDKNEKYATEVSNYLASAREQQGLNIPFLGTGSFSEGTFKARTRYYKDPMTAPTILKTDIPRGQDVDSIDVIFHNLSGPVPDPNTDTGTRLVRNYDVRFRAFIKDINESITPTYNENKYIGRYETFYTYNKVTRDLSFELTIQAFSKDEIKRILDRMSLLTSFAYPKVSRGTNYQTPSIFKVTIGKLYTVQPCILQSLTHRIEEDVSWDIDEQIPMSVKCNMQLRLLDKKSYDTFSFDIYKDTNITLGV